MKVICVSLDNSSSYFVNVRLWSKLADPILKRQAGLVPRKVPRNSISCIYVRSEVLGQGLTYWRKYGIRPSLIMKYH